MPTARDTKVTVRNSAASVTIDLYGGAITDFHLKEEAVNPLSFAYSQDQMPDNNKAGAPYQGHFLCLGRWGAASEGETRAGVPVHGQIANISWQRSNQQQERSIHMQACSPMEGLKVERTLTIDNEAAAYAVEEQVTNTSPLGRLYNMVQHPTLGRPFLNDTTVVNCNAAVGFDQFVQDHPEKGALYWPHVKDREANAFLLTRPEQPYSSVFSFIVNRSDQYGWISAYSPQHRLLLGYIWKRSDYPWIHLWQHWDSDGLQYRGIEFGTAGIHQPFKAILETGIRLFGERTVEYIDAGETVGRRYLSFLCSIDTEVVEPVSIALADKGGKIIVKHGEQEIPVSTQFRDFL